MVCRVSYLRRHFGVSVSVRNTMFISNNINNNINYYYYYYDYCYNNNNSDDNERSNKENMFFFTQYAPDPGAYPGSVRTTMFHIV